MQPHTNDPLASELRAEIAAHGPMPFRRFMEQALYHPEHGYYASGRAAIGRHGDFYTNVSVGPLFGKLLASQFAEMWERLGKPSKFCIVEQGANNGDFAHDALTAARENAPDFFEAIHYEIVEQFEILRARQKQTLGEFAGTKAMWRKSLAEVEPFTGVHFSNELLDALPVHLVVFRNGAWNERHVTLENGRFVFADGPLSNERLRERLEKIAPPRIEGYTTEVNLDALGWIDDLAARLERGYVLAIDYGYPREVFYNPARKSGTLACYAQHRRSDDPFQAVGETDITASVEFTSLVERAETCGFTLAGFTDQHHFMVGLSTCAFASGAAPDEKTLRAFKTLMHPEMLGASFKVLALEKGMPTQGALSGFQFGGDPRVALGLGNPLIS